MRCSGLELSRGGVDRKLRCGTGHQHFSVPSGAPFQIEYEVGPALVAQEKVQSAVELSRAPPYRTGRFDRFHDEAGGSEELRERRDGADHQPLHLYALERLPRSQQHRGLLGDQAIEYPLDLGVRRGELRLHRPNGRSRLFEQREEPPPPSWPVVDGLSQLDRVERPQAPVSNLGFDRPESIRAPRGCLTHAFEVVQRAEAFTAVRNFVAVPASVHECVPPREQCSGRPDRIGCIGA